MQSGAALVFWERSFPGDLHDELARLVLDGLDDVAFTTDAGALEADLSEALNAAGYPQTVALRSDIAMIARRHAAVLDTSAIKIRLEVIDTDACRKFHADYVTVRTISTYLGQGTQWIAAGSADEAGVPGGPRIRQIAAGAIAMFKGRLWQEPPSVLHRSPPIQATAEQRLVLVIDPVATANDGIAGAGSVADPGPTRPVVLA